MIAVCRMAPQAAPRRQSDAKAHLTISTGQAHQAWSPMDLAGKHSGTTPGQWRADGHLPARQAGKKSERQLSREVFFSLRQTGRPGTTEEGCHISVIALMESELFLQVSRVTSSFRSATTEGNRFLHSADCSPEGSRISWAYPGDQPVSV